MKTTTKSLLFLGLLLALISCEKNTEPSLGVIPKAGGAARISESCQALAYSDSIYYLNDEKKGDYIVSPMTPSSGTYSASPTGLQINSSTGAINVSKSETGLRYRVFFVAKGTSDTCSRYITIDGVDYPSSLHVLAKNDTLIKPVYNGNSLLSIPKGSEFDDGSDDDDKDGVADEPAPGQEIRSQGVDVDKVTGRINLKKTVTNGLFGSKPANGASRVVKLYYRLNDASKKALNQINIKFVYYERLSDVPANLKAQMGYQNARIASVPTISTGTAYALYEERQVRPPLILIVGR